jgi:hypothetical protein
MLHAPFIDNCLWETFIILGSSQIFELKKMVTFKRVVFNLDMKIMVDAF